MTNRKLGIHLAPGALKLVEVEEQANKFVVQSYSIDYFPPEDGPDTQIKTLISALKENKIRTKNCSVVVSGSEIVYKLIELPQMPEKEVASAIKYKLKATLPDSFKNLENIDVDHYRIQKPQGKGKQLFFVAAVQKEKMLEVSSIIKSAGLACKDILAPSCALKNAFSCGSEPSAVFYLGKYSSIIILIKEGQVVFAREAKIGGDDITQAMVGAVQSETERIELDYKQAEEIKRNYGIPVELKEYSKESKLPASELLAMMRPALEKLGAEILNTFDYYRQEIKDVTEFKKVYVSGGASRTKNLLQYFKEELGLEVAPLTANLQSTKKDFEQDASFLSLALGAVSRGRDHLSLMPKKGGDLLMGSLLAGSVKGIRQWFKYIFVGILFFLVLALVFGWFYLQQGDLNATYKDLQSKYQKRMTELGIEEGKKKETIDLTKYAQKDRFPLIMQELDKITPSDIYFQNLNYDNKKNKLVIRGVMVKTTQMSMPVFIQGLEQSKYLKSIDLAYLREIDTYTVAAYDFELSCDLVVGSNK